MQNSPSLTLLYDGNCVICSRKIAWILRKDAHASLSAIDISSPTFNPSTYEVSEEMLKKEIHAILPDGTSLKGMQAFRAIYSAIGLGWLAAPTGWPILRPIFDFLYATLAANRHKFNRLCKNAACQLPGDKHNN